MREPSLEARVKALEIILKNLNLEYLTPSIINDLNATPALLRSDTKRAVKSILEGKRMKGEKPPNFGKFKKFYDEFKKQKNEEEGHKEPSPSTSSKLPKP